MRQPHYLREALSTAMPREFVVFDTETTPHPIDPRTVEHKLVFGWAAFVRRNRHGNWSAPRWFRFETGAEFWQWVEELAQPKRKLYVFCHNGNFDWQASGMLSHLPALGWTCEKAIIEDPPNYFLWRSDKRVIALLDTLNYWRVSLKEIGKRVGIDKLELPYGFHDPIKSDIYCKRDVEILVKALLDWFAWLQRYDLGAFAISLASQAWTAYRHRFMQHDIFLDDNEEAADLSRASYMGGRTEAWRIGEYNRNITVLDVNGMYPFVMKGNRYPTKLIGLYKRVEVDELTTWLEDYCCIAHVKIRTEQPIYPERTDFGIVFPVGEFWTYLASPELSEALRRGHVVECSECAVYECAEIFTEFVDEVYALRRGFIDAGDETGGWFIKILGNSLYGKFGQRGGHEEIIGYTGDTALHVETEYDIDTGRKYRVRHIAGLILSRSLDSETRDSFPAIAAHVTSYARLLLWSYAETAGLDHVYYMDTDSLHVDRTALQRLRPLIDQSRLGSLKVERTVFRAIYHGAKDYRLDDYWRTKGIRKKARVISYNTYRQEQWVSLSGSAAAAHLGGPLVRKITKHLNRIYRKGIVKPDGRVLPLRREAS